MKDCLLRLSVKTWPVVVALQSDCLTSKAGIFAHKTVRPRFDRPDNLLAYPGDEWIRPAYHDGVLALGVRVVCWCVLQRARELLVWERLERRRARLEVPSDQAQEVGGLEGFPRLCLRGHFRVNHHSIRHRRQGQLIAQS